MMRASVVFPQPADPHKNNGAYLIAIDVRTKRLPGDKNGGLPDEIFTAWRAESTRQRASGVVRMRIANESGAEQAHVTKPVLQCGRKVQMR